MLLLRRYYDDRTEGKFVMPWGTFCYNLERPWLNNEVNESCIPEGEYVVKRDKVGRWQYYRVMDVKGRTNIELHAGNVVSHSDGCLLPCMELKDGRGIRSREACQKFLDEFKDNGFILTIRKWNTHDGKWKE